MKKELSTTKGNLIEMLIETEDGKAVLIHPFYLGATAIVFTDNWEFDDRYVGEYGRGQ